MTAECRDCHSDNPRTASSATSAATGFSWPGRPRSPSPRLWRSWRGWPPRAVLPPASTPFSRRWPRGDGGRLHGRRYDAQEAGRAEVPPAELAREKRRKGGSSGKRRRRRPCTIPTSAPSMRWRRPTERPTSRWITSRGNPEGADVQEPLHDRRGLRWPSRSAGLGRSPSKRNCSPGHQEREHHDDGQGQAKIMDFGLAKVAGGPDHERGVNDGDRGLHVARAGAGRGGRPADGHLVAGSRPL